MNSDRSHRRADAFTLVELLCVIAIIGILASLILSAVDQAKQRALRTGCDSHLRQLGIAFQLFTHDHDGKYPMAVPMADGGSLEFVENGYAVGGEFYFAYRHFQTLSNELGTPNMVICPTDTRLPATNFAGLQNSNVSYFVGVKADFGQPDSLLAGDRNLTASWFPNPSILSIAAANRLTWQSGLHQFKGNFLFADGRVEEWNNSMLAGTGGQLAGADLFMPTVIGWNSVPATAVAYGNPNYNSGSGAPTPPSALAPTAPPPSPLSPAPPGVSGQPGQEFANGGRFDAAPVNSGANPPPLDAISGGSTNANAPASNAPVAGPATRGTIPPQAVEADAPNFDARLAQTLRRAIIGFYLLILLVFVLWGLYAWWRRWQRKRNESEN